MFVGTSLGGLVTMVIAAMTPQRINGAILNDVGPDVDPGGIERILSYVGKDLRFASWDEAADAIAVNQRGAFERFTTRRLGEDGEAQLPRGEWRNPLRL